MDLERRYRRPRTMARRRTKPKPEAERRVLLKTSEVLARSGITRQMLYLYTTMGLVDPVETTAAGHKLFGEDVLAKLKIVRDALETGYSLRDVKEVFFESRARRTS
jgi:DNA-binding transcriptional MerR regulator